MRKCRIDTDGVASSVLTTVDAERNVCGAEDQVGNQQRERDAREFDGWPITLCAIS